MNCLKCKGVMKSDFTTFTLDTGECCIVIRHVPCLKCNACGEVIYTAEVSENLERIVKSSKQALTEVAVVKYTEAVA